MLAGCFAMGCEKVVVLSMYRKSHGKLSSITNSLRSQTKVWELATLVKKHRVAFNKYNYLLHISQMIQIVFVGVVALN